MKSYYIQIDERDESVLMEVLRRFSVKIKPADDIPAPANSKAKKQLLKTMSEMGNKATERGLTDEILNEILNEQ